MTRVALYGGSFNPPHVAHQMAALLVLETQEVDQLWVVPTFRHPFSKDLQPFEHRLAMCELAFAPIGPRARVSRIEEELNRPASRTLDTIEALRERHPGFGFRLVVGADILGETDKWHRWSDIERLAPPIVVGRSGYSSPHELELPAVSSTEVRQRLSRGQNAIPLVPRAVMNYIAKHGLYQPESSS
jgi:nicotinate-nucleotide adenylyltransferase